MYKTPRIIQVHESNTEPIQANRGILAGCGYAVRYLKAMINEEVTDDQTELRDFVDDVVRFQRRGNRRTNYRWTTQGFHSSRTTTH
eukprot:10937351-Heterocapsa_arctica.AAC.1